MNNLRIPHARNRIAPAHQIEEESIKPLDVRNEMVDVKTKLHGLKLERDKAAETLTGILVLVAHAMRGRGSKLKRLDVPRPFPDFH